MNFLAYRRKFGKSHFFFSLLPFSFIMLLVTFLQISYHHSYIIIINRATFYFFHGISSAVTWHHKFRDFLDLEEVKDQLIQSFNFTNWEIIVQRVGCQPKSQSKVWFLEELKFQSLCLGPLTAGSVLFQLFSWC